MHMTGTTSSPRTRDSLLLEPVSASDPTIARWLGAMQDSRRRTLECLAGIDAAAIDFERASENTIGTLLYHIAIIEADWLYVEVLETDFPADTVALFPWDVRIAGGRLTPVAGRSLDEHLELLATVRERLIAAFADMALDDFRRARVLDRYDVTPEWVLHHLMQHEAEHRGQIGLLRAAAERRLTTG
jgi:uncharacterized damage-inducible protein DinB